MRSTTFKTLARVAVAGMALGGGAAQAADAYLQVRRFDKELTLPDATSSTVVVPMWGFASCTDDTFTACGGTIDAPGPRIDAVPGESLTIHVDNTLTTPISIAIPGQAESGAAQPAMFSDASGRSRVRSFTHEVAAQSRGSYTWPALRAGTYLYQSGTYPSIQVPMGLYGSLVVAAPAPAEAYPGIARDADHVLLFSEIDPVQNGLVDGLGNNVAAYPSTVDYNPIYFLINGSLSADLPAADATGANVLLRLANAGLRSHTPSFVGLELGLVAEDGHPYPGMPRMQTAALVAAGKTLDALVTLPAADVSFSLYDRMPAFTNDDVPNNGFVGSLVVGNGTPPAPPPTVFAVDDTYAVGEDAEFTATVSVLSNDANLSGAALVGGPSNGVLQCNGSPGICASGTFTYTPNPDFSGIDSFSYNAGNGTNLYAANVELNVSFVNDRPVGASDSYTSAFGGSIAVDAAHGVLGNDQDADGDTLTAVLVSGSVTLSPDGSFSHGGGSTTFTYTATDGTLTSNPVTVSVAINPASNLVLNVRDPSGASVTGFRWTLEEDTTWHPNPGAVVPPADTLATNFHRSYMPVVAQGSGAAQFATVALDPLKHYYVSVLPANAYSGAGHTLGGAQIPPAAARASNTISVNVNPQPLPYAQISAYIFEDNSPTNGAVDGAETGLGGFQITLEDAGGRYGISAGTMSLDADGNLLRNALDCFGGDAPPPGVILTCPDTPANRTAGVVGEVLIKNLWPGKYGVIATPPLGSSTQWIQTSTIEGTKVIDAWVKAGEPPFFQEFGPAGWHAFIGFVSPANVAAVNPGGSNTITGKVTNMHMARPPNQELFDSQSYAALAHTRAWVGLNSEGGVGPNFAAVQAGADGSFTISNVPNGTYQLVVWDTYLDQVIAYRGVTFPGSGAVGNVPVFNWFARLEHNVFFDADGDGVRDEAEEPLPEQNVNVRWRDGSVYQSFPTDRDGFVPFDQTFPFFHWLVAEVDYARYRPTGLTVTVDGGGDVAATGGILNPQVQADGATSRTETGPVLTQGFQGFLGQTSVFDWGKAPYARGENGGISGIVYYASTRAESDPRLGVGDVWEPGVPRAKVRLYREVAAQGGGTSLALVEEAETDSWDDNLPEHCPGFDSTDPVSPPDKCYDGLRNFNQARPAVFDGGYAFGADGSLPPGRYVVEIVPPPGYDLVKEEDVNVGFGDLFANAPVAVSVGGVPPAALPDGAMVRAALGPEPGLAQPPCVGVVRNVPEYLSLFPAAFEPAPFALAARALCNRKLVTLADQSQAAADFFLFTAAPVASHFAGMVLDDVAQEFNPLSPQFGEKWAPPFVPVSIRDQNSREISRVYSDQWGRINGLVPSTFTANMPAPSGYSPAMHMTCMNDPGPIPGPDGTMIVDPQYNPAYSNFCYTFQYMPGTTTYLDTPVLPGAAFASGYNPPDCTPDEGTPVIAEVSGAGPGAGPLVAPNGVLTIRSQGSTIVPNPAYEGPLAVGLAGQKTILRNFGFGTAQGSGRVTLGNVALTVLSWSDSEIRVRAPAAPTVGLLLVRRGNGNSTDYGVTVTVSTETPVRVALGGSIQAAIDAPSTSPGALILVPPGTYDEMVILWKPVRLQGAGAGSTIINGVKRPTERIQAWRTQMDCLFGIGAGCAARVSALPSQPAGAIGFETEEGAAITVVGLNGAGPSNFLVGPAARIDGFAITGGDVGGGIFVNGYAHRLEIANNHVFGNSGSYHGGIRVGQPFLELAGNGPFGLNRNVRIHHNSIEQNGGLGGAGGGLSIATGTDGYEVSRNFVCGNFTTGDGGGIAHFGLSDGGRIANNRIVLNQSFNQGVTVSGGGLFVGGEPPAAGALTLGAGDVNVDANFIQGNHAAAGHGGGVRLQFVNGQDVVGSPVPLTWHNVVLTNNVVVNNVAGWSGAGVSLHDAARSSIVGNTIAHNDSTATVAATFTTGNPNISADQPAGIAAERHSAELTAAIPSNALTNPYRIFSNPTLVNDIVWRNRSFHYDASSGTATLVPNLVQSAVGQCPASTNYNDLGVLGGGAANRLSPSYSVLTSTAGYGGSNNVSGNPAFAGAFCNGGRTLVTAPGPLAAMPALDEGGNAWIDVRFGPLDVRGDYHIGSASSGRNNGNLLSLLLPDLGHDFDGQSRPQQLIVDRGADEFAPGTVSFASAAPVALAGGALPFGAIAGSGTRSSTVTLAVAGGPVTFTSLTVLNTNLAAIVANAFTKGADTCSGRTIPAGGTCTVTVTFNFARSTAKTGSLVVVNDGTRGPLQTLGLSGT